MHSPEVKTAAKEISRNGCEALLSDGSICVCSCGADVIRCFEAEPSAALCYEEIVIWGYLINLEKCSLESRLERLERVFKQLDSLDFGSMKSKYTTVENKPKTAQQGTVQGAEPYYVRMGVAWLLATALAKFPEQTRAFARSANLPGDVIKLYIRKARESYRTRIVSPL